MQSVMSSLSGSSISGMRGNVWPHFTLSDKDMSEINAFHSIWPNADYQLCYWHILCALRKWLATRKCAPAPYSTIQAQNQFEFIDYWFIPIGQRHELAGTDVRTKFYLAIKFKKITL